MAAREERPRKVKVDEIGFGILRADITGFCV